MNKKLPDYFKKLLKIYPKIFSGRKNHIKAHKRLIKNLYLTKKFKKNYK